MMAYNPAVRLPRGVITLISKQYAYHRLNINTDLETLAIQINIGKVIAVCNIYITSNQALNIGYTTNLIAQLPKPFLIVRDFNACSIAWGDVESNDHGGVIENLLQSSEVCILNTGSLTHVHKQTDTLTCVDLTLTSLDIFVDVEWQVEDDLYGSDYFSCCIAVIVPVAAGGYNNT